MTVLTVTVLTVTVLDVHLGLGLTSGFRLGLGLALGFETLSTAVATTYLL